MLINKADGTLFLFIQGREESINDANDLLVVGEVGEVREQRIHRAIDGL